LELVASKLGHRPETTGEEETVVIKKAEVEIAEEGVPKVVGVGVVAVVAAVVVVAVVEGVITLILVVEVVAVTTVVKAVLVTVVEVMVAATGELVRAGVGEEGVGKRNDRGAC
jgi:hypothetical protein